MGLRSWLGGVMNFVPPDLEDDEYERDVADHKRRQMLESGELVEDDEMPGQSVVHWAPIRPIATRERPRYPGFYAYRPPTTTRWRVVEVLASVEGLLWWAYADELPAHRLDETVGEWSSAALVLPR